MPVYPFAVCFCISCHPLIILYVVFFTNPYTNLSILFAYLLAVFFIVQIHYANSSLLYVSFPLWGGLLN